MQSDREQPETARIEVHRDGDQTTLLVRPIPLFAVRGGMSVVGLAFSGVGAAAAGLFLYGWLLGGGLSSIFTWFWLLLAIPAAGSWFALFVERIAQKETYFDIIDGALLVTSRRWKHVDQHQWLAEEIQTVRCGDSRLMVDEMPAPQLEIVLHTGEVISMLTGRDREELAWLARRICAELDLPHEPAESSAEDDTDDPSPAEPTTSYPPPTTDSTTPGL